MLALFLAGQPPGGCRRFGGFLFTAIPACARSCSKPQPFSPFAFRDHAPEPHNYPRLLKCCCSGTQPAQINVNPPGICSCCTTYHKPAIGTPRHRHTLLKRSWIVDPPSAPRGVESTDPADQRSWPARTARSPPRRCEITSIAWGPRGLPGWPGRKCADGGCAALLLRC